MTMILVTSDWEVFRWFQPKSSSSSPPRPRFWYQPRLGGAGCEPFKGCKFTVITPLMFKMIYGFWPKKLTCSLRYFCNYVLSTNCNIFAIMWFLQVGCLLLFWRQQWGVTSSSGSDGVDLKKMSFLFSKCFVLFCFVL